MKILCLTNLFPPHEVGGYEVRCGQVMSRLAARGHQILVLTGDHRTAGGSGQPECPGLVTERRLILHGYLGRPWLPLRRLRTVEARNHATLEEVLASFRPDLVHVWNMGGLNKSLLLRLEAGPRPVVYDISDHWVARSLRADAWLRWWGGPTGPVRRLVRTLLRGSGVMRWLAPGVPLGGADRIRFDRAYFCSRYLRDLTARAGFPVSGAGVIYCGVEADRFTVKRHYGPPRSLLWVGRLTEDKDPLTAVRALGVARAAGQPARRLLLCGKGDPACADRLRQTARELGVEEAVTFTEMAAGSMHSLYAAHDALLFTSNWGEPFALTPLEAMAAGLPVILCPDGGEAELGRDGENCLLFETGQADSLAAALARLENRPDGGAGLAAAARAEVLARYTLEASALLIEDFLTAALAGASPAHA